VPLPASLSLGHCRLRASPVLSYGSTDDTTPDDRMEALGFGHTAAELAPAEKSTNLNMALALSALRKLCRTTRVAPSGSATTPVGGSSANSPPPAAVGGNNRARDTPPSVGGAKAVSPVSNGPDRIVTAESPTATLPTAGPGGAPAAKEPSSPPSLFPSPPSERRINRETQRLARNLNAHTQVCDRLKRCPRAWRDVLSNILANDTGCGGCGSRR